LSNGGKHNEDTYSSFESLQLFSGDLELFFILWEIW